MRVRVRQTLQITPNRARGVRKWWEPWRPAGMHALDEDEDEVRERIEQLGWFEQDPIYGSDGPVIHV